MTRINDADRFDLEAALSLDDKELWDAYAEIRPYLTTSASAEAASIMVKNKEAIMNDTAKNARLSLKKLESEQLDEVMRALADILLSKDLSDDDIYEVCNAVESVGEFASFLDSRMCVPRDMGMLSAAAIKRISSIAVNNS